MTPDYHEEIKAKLQTFRTCFIEHDYVKVIYDDFDRLRRNRNLGGEQQCMLVTGDTGCGKSYLIQNYQRKHSDQLMQGYISKPLLVSRIPSNPTLESTIVELIKDLGQFGVLLKGKSGYHKSLTDQLGSLLAKCQTELIIIDEFQELIEFKSGKRRNEIANRLKYISEKSGIPIVLVGMPWASKISEEPQWSSRLFIRRFIPYYTLSTNKESFIRLLKSFSLCMPFEPHPELCVKETALPLFSSCKGCLRTLRYILDEAVSIALEEGAVTLTMHHLAQSFHTTYPERKNPFETPMQDIEFNEIDHYSSFNEDALTEEGTVIESKFKKMALSQLLVK